MVIDAFRLINPQTMMLGQEPRQTTSNLGHLNKPSIQVGACLQRFLKCPTSSPQTARDALLGNQNVCQRT